MLRIESRDVVGGALVVPERHRIARQLAIGVEQHRAMHLAAGADGGNAARHAGLVENCADGALDAGPPVFRPLFGPAELRNDLLMLDGAYGDDAPLAIHKCRANAAGAYVDRQIKLFAHTVLPDGRQVSC